MRRPARAAAGVLAAVGPLPLDTLLAAVTRSAYPPARSRQITCNRALAAHAVTGTRAA